jgi:hypothetical protein
LEAVSDLTAVEISNPPHRPRKEVVEGVGTISAVGSTHLTATHRREPQPDPVGAGTSAAPGSPTSSEPHVDYGVGVSSAEDEIGFVTPPPRNRPPGPLDSLLSLPTYLGPLSHYSSIDDDSEDTTWMADYQDFTRMDSSNDDNSDWIVGEEPLSDFVGGEEDLDVAEYVEYRFVDVDQCAALERVRYLY